MKNIVFLILIFRVVWMWLSLFWFILVPRDCLIHGVKSLRQGLQEYWETGVYPSDRVQHNSEDYYDEDSTTQVDPSTDFSLDKFERIEKIVEVASERERKKHEDDLGVASDEELKK